MTRMIIADDNNRDRRIIQEIIDWQGNGIEIVGVASNGREALELACEMRPELVLSDISMPGISGIELAGELRVRHPEIKILFMSWHNDFEYAKSAVNLNVCGYVMKPIEPDELIAAVLHVLGIVDEERLRRDTQTRLQRQIEESLPFVQEEFFRELLFARSTDGSNLQERADYLRLNLRNATVQVLLLRIQLAAKEIIGQYAIGFYIKDSLRALESENLRLFFVRLTHEEYAILAMAPDGHDQSGQGVLDVAAELYSSLASRYDASPVIAISKPGAPQSIPELYRQAQWTLQSKFYSFASPILQYHEIEDHADAAFEHRVNLGELYDDVREAMASPNEEEAQRIVQRYLSIRGNRESDVFYKSVAFSICHILQLMLIEGNAQGVDVFGGEVAWSRLDSLPSLPQLQAWCRDVLLNTHRALNARSRTRDAQIVQDIKDIVRRRYAEQITVNDIVNVVYISARQANKIFKKLTGLTIFDYLLEYRIQVAKDLLKNPYNRIYQVAEQVGYLNKSHFCVVFKKLTGQTPAEYRYNPV